MFVQRKLFMLCIFTEHCSSPNGMFCLKYPVYVGPAGLDYHYCICPEQTRLWTPGRAAAAAAVLATSMSFSRVKGNDPSGQEKNLPSHIGLSHCKVWRNEWQLVKVRLLCIDTCGWSLLGKRVIEFLCSQYQQCYPMRAAQRSLSLPLTAATLPEDNTGWVKCEECPR